MSGIFTKASLLPELLKNIFLLNFENIYTFHNLEILLEASLFIYVSFLAGNLALKAAGIQFSSSAKKVAYSVMLGYGIFGTAGLLLAVLGKFTALNIRLVFIAVAILSLREILTHLRSLVNSSFSFVKFKIYFNRFFRENFFLKLIVAVWLIINFAVVFVPITGHDTLDYHLPLIKSILDKGRIDFYLSSSGYFPTILSGTVPSKFLPLLGEIIYTAPLLIFNNFNEPFIFQLLQYSMLILLIALLYDFLRERLENKFLAIVGVLLTLSIMDLQREIMHGGYIDVLAFLFGIASSLLVIDNCCREEMSQKELSLSALMLGLALGVKYLALNFAAINVLFLAGAFLYKRIPANEAIEGLIKYSFIAFLVSGFWYLKNLVLFGNPVHPMFSSSLFTSQVNMFLMDRTSLNFFAFPFYRYGQWFVQEVETSSRLIILGYFILAYLLILLFAAFRRRFNCSEILLFAFVQLYLLFLFVTSHQYRFLLPAVIMLVPLLALLADRLYKFLQERLSERFYKIFLKSSIAGLNLFFLFMLLANIHFFHVKFLYATGIYDQEEYILEIGGF